MSQADPVPTVSDALQARLEAWPAVALVIDAAAARLVAANAPGRALFPSLATSGVVALDSAMPAVRKVRDTAAAADPSRPEPYLFWTAAGSRSLTCTREPVPETHGRGLVLLLERDHDTPADSEPLPPEATPPVRNPVRTDRETLREIARRIRDGQAKRERSDAAIPALLPEAPANGETEAAPQPHTEPAAASHDAAATPAIDLAKLAHELKTPVSAIAAASEIMKDGRFGAIGNERYAGYIADIHASARHALALIDRMLQRPSAETDSEAPLLTFTRIALEPLVDECVSTIRPLAEAKGVALTAAHGRSPIVVTADATSLKQIVLNLLTNAVKFTPAQGGIAVRTERRREDGAPVLSVADTGPGMSPLAIAEALRPVPLQLGDRRAGGGFGIGLPLSRALTEAMGATLTIVSPPGQGTRVTLQFPHGRIVPI